MLGKIHPFCLFFAKRGVLWGIIFVLLISYLQKYIPFACFLPKGVYFWELSLFFQFHAWKNTSLLLVFA